MENLPPRLINPALRKRKGSNYLLLRSQDDRVTITAIRSNGAIHQNIVLHVEELAAIAEGAVPRETLQGLLTPSANPAQFAGFGDRLMVPSGQGVRAKPPAEELYDAVEIRRELREILKRPIPDEAWEELCREELVAEVMIDPAAMSRLVWRARRLVPAPIKVVKDRSSGKSRGGARKKSEGGVAIASTSGGRVPRPPAEEESADA